MLRRLFEHTPGPRQLVQVDDAIDHLVLRVRTDPVTILAPLPRGQVEQLVEVLADWLDATAVPARRAGSTVQV